MSLRQCAAALAAVFLITAPSTSANAQAASDCVINLHKKTSRGGGDSYWAPVTIRGISDMRLTVEGMIDTGFAGELQLPRSLVDQLRAHNMVQRDSGEKITAVLANANGATVEEDVIYVHAAQLSDGGYFGFVQIIVADDRAVPLTGQGLLSAYLSTRIDYENDRILVLKGFPPSLSVPLCATPAACRPAPDAVPFFIPSSKPRR
jgi:predicted aspartyl protease